MFIPSPDIGTNPVGSPAVFLAVSNELVGTSALFVKYVDLNFQVLHFKSSLFEEALFLLG